eukprot:4020093-Pleurochrysis_carterae.AAC.1
MPSAVRAPYQTLRCPAKEPPQAVFVVIPGNPGIASFYQRFAAAVNAQLAADVQVMGLAGHVGRGTPGYNAFGSVPTLSDQLDHLCSTIKPLAERCQAEKMQLIILGHSIGCWLALMVARRLRAEATLKDVSPQLLLVTPYLQNNRDVRSFEVKYQLMRWAPWLIPFICIFAEILGRLPARLKKVLLPIDVSKFDTQAVKVVQEEMLCFGAVNNYLRLGRTEFVALDPLFDWSSLRTDGDVRMLYADNDEWGTVANMHAVRAQDIPVDFETSLQHAFVTTEAGNKRVVDWVVKQVRPSVTSARTSQS